MKLYEKMNKGKEERKVGGVKSLLVAPEKDWPPCGKELSMSCIEGRDGFKLFKFRMSEGYRQKQLEFRSIQQSMDIQQLLYFLQKNPFHHETLLYLSDFFKMQGHFPESTKLIKRAIYSFERALSVEFKITDPVPQT